MKKILALIDLTHPDPQVARMAGHMGRAFDASVWLVHIVNPDSDYDGGELREDVSRGGLAHEIRRKKRALQLMAAVLKREGTRASALVIRGSPMRKALAEVKRRQPDCVILGRSRHGWVHQMFQGSLGAAMAKAAQCAVMIVPVEAGRRAARSRRGQ